MNEKININDMNVEAKPSFFSKLKKPSKKMFWAWIAYQTVKGTLTTSLIWIPLIYAWFHHF
ncbi:MAG: hypothetical protein CBB87_06230 [Micavibrio sp. TMED27]|nr:hypothetical protein [Micavibrio sp.]OUT91607.1 MAG: hypothetical protein CBB87_06230 [Micavibrio sp. TMED27]